MPCRAARAVHTVSAAHRGPGRTQLQRRRGLPSSAPRTGLGERSRPAGGLRAGSRLTSARGASGVASVVMAAVPHSGASRAEARGGASGVVRDAYPTASIATVSAGCGGVMSMAAAGRGGPVAPATMAQLGALPFPLASRSPGKAAEEPGAPVVVLAALIFIFVVPAPRTGDVSWGWLAPVARDALAVDDTVAPGLRCASSLQLCHARTAALRRGCTLALQFSVLHSLFSGVSLVCVGVAIEQ